MRSQVQSKIRFSGAIGIALILLVFSTKANAGPTAVSLHATQDIILADGKQQTTIWADVHDSNGRPVNGAAVQFQTTAGTLVQSRVTTFSGRAQTRLVSGTIPGTAHITAIVEGNNVGVSNVLDIEFTNDPDDTFAGNSFLLTTGKYVAYSALDHAIEAHGDNGTAKISYRNFEVSADRLQLKCDQTSILRAFNHVTLKRGKSVVHALRLYYSLDSGDGFAIAEVNGLLQDVAISGEHLTLKPTIGKITASYLNLPELNTKLIVAANSISYFPGDRLQFRRPRFFQDGLQIVALPYYEMPLNSEELFSDHFVSVGSRGLGLEVPYYYNLSPKTSGIIFLRHQQDLGRGYSTTEPGWSMELQQNYINNGSLRSEGSYGVTGLLQGDWGLHWNHSQEFNSNMQGNFDLEFPHHDSMFSSASLTQQQKTFRVGFDMSAGKTFSGLSENTVQGDAYAETNPHPLLGQSGLQYVFGTRFSAGSVDSPDPALRASAQTLGEVTMRTYTRPLMIDKKTSLTSSFTVGQVLATHNASGTEGIASVLLDHRLSHDGTLALGFDYGSSPLDTFYSEGKTRVSLTYRFAPSKRFQADLFGSAYLDSSTRNLIADVSYRLTPDWRVMMMATVEKANLDSYNDFEFVLGRRIGTREIRLTYSTWSHRFYFDLASTNW